MEKPYKYLIHNLITRDLSETNDISAYYLNNPDFDVWEDTRYEARVRMYKYWQKSNGITEQVYKPFEGTEIGKSIPILNF